MSAGSASRRRPASHGLPDTGFVLDTRSLGRRPGTMRELHRQVTAGERIGLDMVHIPEGADIDLDLTLQAVSEGVLVTGTVSAPLAGECSRCLEPFTDSVELPITELFAYPDSATEQTTEEDEIYRMVDDRLDLEPVVIDAIGLELPLQPLCTPDCAGLCPECGVRMAIAGSGHGHETLDPRWAGLAKFASDPAGGAGTDAAPGPEDHPPSDRAADQARSHTEEK
ncbi:YceD family protein [Nocardia sp. NPDC057353]|uniref:YceD family protein n=1 Tax=Nocardia sp. NPDC057353 TaxID=3346104 RepID=UPI00364450A3